MTFPLSEGQIPIYYNHFNTGRPATSDSDRFYRSAYIDLSIYPKYSFGYGLSYSKFDYSDLKVSATSLKGYQTLKASVHITNRGSYDGEEVVQLYIRDMVGSVVRPVKELKGFKKVMIKKSESIIVTFEITPESLKFYNDSLIYDWESGEFEIMIGPNAQDLLSSKINWEK